MLAWICPHCSVVNTVRELMCDRCSAERLAPPVRPVAWAPARPWTPPVEIVLTPEEDALIRKELARFREIVGLPPRPDTPPGVEVTPPAVAPAPAPVAGTPVRVLARRIVPALEAWGLDAAAGASP